MARVLASAPGCQLPIGGVCAASAGTGRLRSRTSIDVACGVIMGQNQCSYEEAFNILATASSHRNIKVRVLAESLLEDLSGGTPSTHFKG
ncbi:ANTAR domain-containing protein [Pseudarthrobacter sp. Y6]|uniref:ANTAR domain-containing protein n=1 Tax=Pseudarthrobacter sp. Y6 TaxID=3418422 RepID=UPI003CF6A3DE